MKQNKCIGVSKSFLLKSGLSLLLTFLISNSPLFARSNPILKAIKIPKKAPFTIHLFDKAKKAKNHRGKKKNFYLSEGFKNWTKNFKLSLKTPGSLEKPFYYAPILYKNKVVWAPISALSIDHQGRGTLKQETYTIPHPSSRAISPKQKKKISPRFLTVEAYKKLDSSSKRAYIKGLRTAFFQFEIKLRKKLSQKSRKKKLNILESFYSLNSHVLHFFSLARAEQSNRCVIGGILRRRVGGKCPTQNRGENCRGISDAFKCGIIYNNICIEREPIQTLSERCYTEADNQNTFPTHELYNDFRETIQRIYREYCDSSQDSSSDLNRPCDFFVARVNSLETLYNETQMTQNETPPISPTDNPPTPQNEDSSQELSQPTQNPTHGASSNLPADDNHPTPQNEDNDQTLSQFCASVKFDSVRTESGCLHCTERSIYYNRLQRIQTALTGISEKLEIVREKKQTNLKERKKLCIGANDQYIKTFRNNLLGTCKPPMTIKNIACEACRNDIPPEILLAIASQESDGRCNVTGDIGSSSQSRGLFQINDNSAKNQYLNDCPTCRSIDCGSSEYCPTCNPSIHCGSPTKCEIYNSIINLREGIRILKQKYQGVNDGSSPVEFQCTDERNNRKAKWKNLKREERDRWRKSVAAYNGGEGYVFYAYRDMKNCGFSEEETQVWELRRLFFFRRYFDEKNTHCGASESNRRSIDNTISNIAYTEAILGRDIENGLPSIVDYWASYLNENNLRKNCPNNLQSPETSCTSSR